MSASEDLLSSAAQAARVCTDTAQVARLPKSASAKPSRSSGGLLIEQSGRASLQLNAAYQAHISYRAC
jgi:hypothetical protein